MKFGFDLPTRQLALHTSPAHEREIASRANVVAVAQRGEALGFDSMWVGDHVVIPTTSRGYPYTGGGGYPFDPEKTFFEPIVTLAFLAGCTQRIRLGPSVLIVPYRNPVVTAKMLATLDVLSEGRLILGVGTGWWEEEFLALGLRTFKERGACTDEYLEMFKVLWTQEAPSFKGRFHSFADVSCRPQPLQRPHPPIWVGGQTDRVLERAAKLGDGWQPIAMREPVWLRPDELRGQVSKLHRLLEVNGRDPQTFDVSLRILLRFCDADSERPMIGTPAKVASDILAYRRAGVTHFMFDLMMDSASGMIETLERFAEEVRPNLS